MRNVSNLRGGKIKNIDFCCVYDIILVGACYVRFKMLIKFSVKNFRSIKDSGLDLTCCPEQVAGDDVIVSLTENYADVVDVVPVMALFGANASGKSNLMKGLLNLQQFILTDGITMREPFKLDEIGQDLPTEYVVELLLDGRHCEYSLVVDDVHVIKESLYVMRLNGRRCVFDVDIDKGCNTQGLLAIGNLGDFDKYEFRGCFLSRVYNQYKKFQECKDFEDLRVLVQEALSNYELVRHVFDFFQNKLWIIDKIRGGHSDRALWPKNAGCLKVGDILQDMGLDLVLATYQPGRGMDTEDCVNYYHSGARGGYYKLQSFKQESLGTRNLLLFLQRVVAVLNLGGCLCVDEIDRTLHTDIIVFVLQLFKSPKFNKYGAQLICTSHNPCIMLWLNKFEMAVVSKFNQVSRFIKLSNEDFDVGPQTNLLGEYLDGTFGGVPLLKTSMFYDDDVQDLVDGGES